VNEGPAGPVADGAAVGGEVPGGPGGRCPPQVGNVLVSCLTEQVRVHDGDPLVMAGPVLALFSSMGDVAR
jgi:hypothetical protein